MATAQKWTACAKRLNISRNQFLINLIEANEPGLPAPR